MYDSWHSSHMIKGRCKQISKPKSNADAWTPSKVRGKQRQSPARLAETNVWSWNGWNAETYPHVNCFSPMFSKTGVSLMDLCNLASNLITHKFASPGPEKEWKQVRNSLARSRLSWTLSQVNHFIWIPLQFGVPGVPGKFWSTCKTIKHDRIRDGDEFLIQWLWVLNEIILSISIL